jgi:hypothetical protein
MNSPRTYFIKRGDTDEGPLTVAQINRMKQRRLIAADTPCRSQQESVFHRLDEIFPHIKDHQPPDPAKMAKLKKDIRDNEISLLTKSAFGSAALFWAPLGIGVVTAASAIGMGGVLLFKYRQPIGLLAMLLGGLGLYMRFWRFATR